VLAHDALVPTFDKKLKLAGLADLMRQSFGAGIRQHTFVSLSEMAPARVIEVLDEFMPPAQGSSPLLRIAQVAEELADIVR
jgi:hypothetical protein